MSDISFLKDFKKKLQKLESVEYGISPVSRWYSTGNYSLNRVLSGSYFKGIPESRVSLLAGPSSSGKSFLTANVLKQAQDDGAFILYLDTENAADTDYLEKIGIDLDDDKFLRIDINIIEDVNSVMSDFFKGYIEQHGKNKNGRPIVIALDSIAMLSTSTEAENFDKGGEVKGDQGQRAKRTKAMLRMLCTRITYLPITVICTDHVYPADPLLGQGKWAITNSTRFAMSIIGTVESLKLKDETGTIAGVRMRVESYKSRFTQIGNKTEMNIPYTKRMSPTTGLWPVLEKDKVITKVHGGWTFETEDGKTIKFKEAEMDKPENAELLQQLLKTAEAKIIALAKERFESEEIFGDEAVEEDTPAVTTE